ncbi:MAG: 7-carboxy-7-deazaguanine synthase QueE, partial [Gammaproteobacteria bacterium]
GESARNRYENLVLLGKDDQIKFVICDRADYDWARQWLAEHPELRAEVFFSPSFDELPAAELAEWMLSDGVEARLQLQLHKLLWGDAPGR